MDKKASDYLEKIYKEEIDIHNVKKSINNVDIKTIKLNDFSIKKKPSNKNIKYIHDSAVFRNTLLYKNKNNKDSININSYKPKKSNDNSLVYSNSEKSIKEEKKINDLKVAKKNNFGLKVCKTFKNCGENMKNAKLLFLGRINNKQSMRLSKNYSNKNCLTSKKRGSYFPTTKRLRKIKEKETSENNNEILKKRIFHKSSNSNNKLLHFSKNNIIQGFENFKKENNKEKEIHKESNNDINNLDNNKYYYKDNKENDANLFSHFNRKRTKSNNIKHYITNNSNSNKNKKGITFSIKEKLENDKSKKKIVQKSPKNNQEIVYDTDNEVENKILSILDKSFNKRNSVINNKKKKHYCTQELVNDKFFKNFHNSVAFKNNKTNNYNYDKISNFSNISIIKKTEINNYDINNNDESDDLFNDNFRKKGAKFRGISTQKVVSFEYQDNDKEDKRNENGNNHNTKNKKKKKFIIYNNINYYRNTQKEDNDDSIIKDKNIDNEEKDDIFIHNKKNSFSNNFSNHCCSLFNCCFLLD